MREYKTTTEEMKCSVVEDNTSTTSDTLISLTAKQEVINTQQDYRVIGEDSSLRYVPRQQEQKGAKSLNSTENSAISTDVSKSDAVKTDTNAKKAEKSTNTKHKNAKKTTPMQKADLYFNVDSLGMTETELKAYRERLEFRLKRNEWCVDDLKTRWRNSEKNVKTLKILHELTGLSNKDLMFLLELSEVYK